MRFGLSLPHYGFSLPTASISYDDVIGWARRAEALGFDSAWVSDHFSYSFSRYGADPSPIASLEPLSMLAAVAAATDRVRLGSLVLCAPFRHPALLGRAVAALDRLSGGRFELGLGAGWLQEEFEAFGYPFGSIGDRFTALEETVEVIRRLAAGEPVSFEGRTASLRDAVLRPAPGGDLTIWLGGKGGPRLLRLAARRAAGWNVVWRMSPAAYEAKLRDVRAACRQEGRDPATLALSVGLYSTIGEDEAAARAAFEDLGVHELIVAPWVLPFAIHEPEQVELFAERVIGALRPT